MDRFLIVVDGVRGERVYRSCVFVECLWGFEKMDFNRVWGNVCLGIFYINKLYG